MQSLYKKWEYLNHEGRRSHKSNQIKHAIHYFEQAAQVSVYMRYFIPKHPEVYSGLYMAYMSNHNLAACYNSNQQCAKGKEVLLELHNNLMTITANRFNPKALRLEALAIIDKSLFSLVSQLAYLNDTSDIHSYIKETDILVGKAVSYTHLTLPTILRVYIFLPTSPSYSHLPLIHLSPQY